MAASSYRHRRRVHFHETDLAGIVHFSNFFRMMEEAEHAFFRSLGFSIHPASTTAAPIRQGWPRVRAACDFQAPLFFEEEIEIEIRVQEIRQRSIRYQCLFWKHPDGLAEERVRAAVGELVVARVEADRGTGKMKAIPLPAEVIAALEVYATE